MTEPMSSLKIEYKIAEYFCPRRNIIVPNVWWGMGFNHELDLLVLTPSGWAYEVEIKTSSADLKADLKKGHGHRSQKIRKLYFAIPESLKASVDLIPGHAGILVVMQARKFGNNGFYPGGVEKLREAELNPVARRLTANERLKLAELGTMRIWPLKRDCMAWSKYHADPDKWRLDYMG